MTRDRLPVEKMGINIPTLAQTTEGLQSLRAKLAFVRRSSPLLSECETGLTLILEEIIDGLESVTNDLDVICESAPS
ncbi:MAG: hypothetical protein HQL87_05685 [Magnetococcales bacterium]|nr:hypothetical protein [Magnetococcales bacterium]